MFKTKDHETRFAEIESAIAIVVVKLEIIAKQNAALATMVETLGGFSIETLKKMQEEIESMANGESHG